MCAEDAAQCAVKEPEAQQGSELLTPEQCAHDNDPETCETCASEARIASVQALINALPEDVTAETRETVQSALSAVDAAKSALTEAEQGQLDMTRYSALTEKLASAELLVPAGDKVVTAWAWVGDEELDEETDGLALPGASAETPAYFVDVVTFLPYEITATVDGVAETLSVDWACDNYPKAGAYEGEYTFTATLPEGYALGEGVKPLTVSVLLGGGTMWATTANNISYRSCDSNGQSWQTEICDSATVVESTTDAVTWTDGWYVVQASDTP